MKPVAFREQSGVLNPDQGVDAKPLPVFQNERDNISCWEMSPEELETVKKTGRVYVGVSRGKPTVLWLTPENPFEVINM